MATPSTSGEMRAGLYLISLGLFATTGLIGGWFANDYFVSKEPEHEEHGHEHGDDKDSLVLSDQARRNIDLQLGKIATKDYVRTISVPGKVAERAGKTALHVPAPFSGVVTRIFIEPGLAVQPGEDLFELTLTHEDLVAAQGDLLKTVEEMDVAQAEIKRLEALTAIAGKSLLDRQYEYQKLEAVQRSQRQALLLHGLTEEQVAAIVQTRKLLKSLIVKVPESKERSEQAEKTYQVESLPVDLGQHVEAGADLVTLADHALLMVEGNAFEQDLAAVQDLLQHNRPITAVFDSHGDHPQQVAGLKINYLAPTLNDESRTVAFYVWLPNELQQDEIREGRRQIDWKYRPGQRVELAIPVETWQEQLVVPMTAVAIDGPEAYLFQANGSQFVRRPVHVKFRNPEIAVVANDGSIFPGDMIAMTGAQQLQIALKNKASGPIDPHAGHNH